MLQLSIYSDLMLFYTNQSALLCALCNWVGKNQSIVFLLFYAYPSRKMSQTISVLSSCQYWLKLATVSLLLCDWKWHICFIALAVEHSFKSVEIRIGSSSRMHVNFWCKYLGFVCVWTSFYVNLLLIWSQNINFGAFYPEKTATSPWSVGILCPCSCYKVYKIVCASIRIMQMKVGFWFKRSI